MKKNMPICYYLISTITMNRNRSDNFSGVDGLSSSIPPNFAIRRNRRNRSDNFSGVDGLSSSIHPNSAIRMNRRNRSDNFSGVDGLSSSVQ